MRTLAVVVLLLSLDGCAAPPSGPVDPIVAQCRYEVEIAVQPIANPLYAGVRAAELMNMCVTARRAAQNK